MPSVFVQNQAMSPDSEDEGEEEGKIFTKLFLNILFSFLTFKNQVHKMVHSPINYRKGNALCKGNWGQETPLPHFPV